MKTAEPAAAAPADSMSPVLLRIAAVAGCGALILNLSATTLNVALDKLLHDLHTTLGVAQWTITGYLLTLTLVLPTFRLMVERFGMKRLYISSLLGFAAASALCTAAWSIESLIVFRMLQGAVGGLLTPIAQALTAQHAGPRQMGRLLSIVSIPVLVAPLFGPFIGGALVQHLTWRSIFLFNVPLGLLCAVLCARYLPRDEVRRDNVPRLDVMGLSLLSPGMALAIYGISNLRKSEGIAALVPLVAAAALLVLFFMHARRRPDSALIDIRLFQERTVKAALLTYIFTSVAMFGGQLLLPLYYQQVRGQTPMGAGLLMAAQGLGMVLALPMIGRLTDRYDPGKLATAGVLLTLLGTVAFAVASTTTSLWLLSLSLVVRGVGMGATSNPVITAVYRHLPKSEIANATTALNIAQRTGAPLGTAIMALILQWRIGACTSIADAFAQTFAVSLMLNALTLLFTRFLDGTKPGPASTDSPR